MVIKCLKQYFSKHFFILLFIILIIISITLLSLIPPQLIRIILDNIIPSKNKDKLFLFALFYLLVYIFIGVVNFLKELVLVIMAQGFSKFLRKIMMKHLHNMTFKNLTKYDSGIFEAYFNNDVDAINTLITSGVVSMAIDLFKIIGILISIFIFSIKFGFMTICLIPIIISITFIFRKLMFKSQLKNRMLEGKVNNSILETLDNIKTIKSFSYYENSSLKYKQLLEDHYQTTLKANYYDSVFSPIMLMIKTSVIILLMGVSSYNQNIFNMSLGMIVSSIDLLTNLFNPIENLGTELQTIQKSMAGIKRIDDFLKLEEDEDVKIFEMDNLEISIEFKDVTYSYDGVNNVIENFNLKMKNNDKLTLKGRSGAGKSTIFKLAYGVIKPTSGQVLINGLEVYYMSDEIKRKLFGIVYQDVFFSDGTIYEELILNDKTISEEKVYDVLKAVKLDKRVFDIHAKLNKDDYSSGEQALFNIARTIITDAEIIFLDEMSAKIDPITSMHIMKLINDICKDKLVFSINHYGSNLKDSKILSL